MWLRLESEVSRERSQAESPHGTGILLYETSGINKRVETESRTVGPSQRLIGTDFVVTKMLCRGMLRTGHSMGAPQEYCGSSSGPSQCSERHDKVSYTKACFPGVGESYVYAEL